MWPLVALNLIIMLKCYWSLLKLLTTLCDWAGVILESAWYSVLDAWLLFTETSLLHSELRICCQTMAEGGQVTWGLAVVVCTEKPCSAVHCSSWEKTGTIQGDLTIHHINAVHILPQAHTKETKVNLGTVQWAHTWAHTYIHIYMPSNYWARFTVPRFIFVYVCVCVYLVILHTCCIIITWWVGSGGIEA